MGRNADEPRNNVLQSGLNEFNLSSSTLHDLLNKPEDVADILSGVQNSQDVRRALLAAYQRGFRIVFYVGAGLSTVAFLLAFFLMPQVDLNRADDAKLKEEGRKADEARRQKKAVAGNEQNRDVEKDTR